MEKEKRKIGELPIDEMKQEVNDFINEVRENEPVLTDSFESIESPEYSEVTVDEERKLLSYRKKDGTKVENVGIETNSLILGREGLDNLAAALKVTGLGANDWSDYISEDGNKPLQLPEPRCAIVNFTGISSFPTAKNVNYKAYMRYYDCLGNSFIKKVILNGQGSSSIQYNNQKNIAVDLFDSDWDGDAFALKIGNWVPQDSFHIKTFYMDPVRGLADICYKYAEYVIRETNTRPDRFTKGAENVTVHGDSGVIQNDYDTGALCHPDGFPCFVYLNGEFIGIYAWNLKKNRKNYSMDKKDYESVHVDPAFSNLWNLKSINWEGIEVRNPKTLICMDGSEYDGDHPKELIDSSSEFYDSTNKDHKNTVKTKNIITGLHDSILAINDASTIEDKKALFEQTFDVDGFIVYWIVSQLFDNWDGLRDRNAQWLRYKKTGKWCPSFYDLDNCFGYCGYPWLNAPIESLTQRFYSENLTNSWIWLLYRDEIVAKYQELRQSGVISTDAYMKYYNDWCGRIDPLYIELNAKMWDVPCYRDGKVNKEYWKQVGIVSGSTVTYDEDHDYVVGNKVTYGKGNYIMGAYVVQFECVKACKGQIPCELYPNMPQAGGTFDSPRRVKAWLDAKISILDSLITNN